MGADLAAEEQFGPYLVYERLGVGGMATVHRALERGLADFERVVALKRLLPHLAEDASFIKSFVREAKLASLLNHHNIVQIFELGRVGAEYFISMEYIDGRDIRQILRHARRVTGPPPLNVTVGLLLQLCEALDYAHTKVDEAGQPLGLVHRDVSPSNLLVTPAGHLKVIDFGIAKAQSQQLRTQTGRVKGKLAYMAPEAISGSKDVDARSDLFAVGVIAHELLTARPLFASKNEYQTLLKVQRGELSPPSTYNPSVPPSLDAVVLHALARDPDQRHGSATELRDALLAVRQEHKLATGPRDIAGWLTYAFSLEAADQDANSSSIGIPLTDPGSLRTPTARPLAGSAQRDEEEAVQVAWGGGEQDEPSGEIDLDAVPDVSEKHLKPDLSGAIHGAAAAPPSQAPAPRATTMPTGVPRANAHLSIPAGLTPPRVKTMTIPVVTIPAKAEPAIAVPRTISDSQPPFTHRAATGSGAPPTRAARIASATIPPGPAVPRPNAAAARSMTDLGGPNDTGRHSEITSDPVPGETLQGTPAPTADATLRDSVARFAEAAELVPPSTPAPTARPPRGSSQPARRGPAPTPATKPGVTPHRASTAPTVPLAIDRESRSLAPVPTLGTAHGGTPRRTWPLVAGIVALGAAAAGVYVVARRDRDATPSTAMLAPPPGANVPAAPGKLKFDTQPADADITVEGYPTHAGSPWVVALPPGVYSVRIQRAGYKAWLTSIELSSAETFSLRVVLESLEGTNGNDATLVLDSTPSGLEAFIDGASLGGTTPIKTSIAPGAHTIVLRQNGVEVWRQHLSAQANAAYEFNPSMTAEKQRERRARERARVVATTPTGDAASGSALGSGAGGAAVSATSGSAAAPGTIKSDANLPQLARGPLPPLEPTRPATGSAAAPVAGAVTRPAVAKQLPSPTQPSRAAPVASTGPLLIPPTAVKRISGEAPTVGSSRRDEVPAVVAAKVCIDPSGTPYKVDLVTKVERITALDLASTLRSWRYTPYKQSGTAIHACFVVSFRVK